MKCRRKRSRPGRRAGCQRAQFQRGNPQPRHKVTLHDLTIRDGEESADLAFTTADKLKIADALARLGIKRTEVFLTVPGWHEVVRGIMAANLGLDLWVTWMRGKVEKALDLGVRHVMIWHGAGEGPQKYIARQSRPQLIDQLAAKIETAKAAGCKVNVFMPESTRSDVAHLLDVARMAEEQGADAITIVDSQGVMRPAAMTWLVRQIKKRQSSRSRSTATTISALPSPTFSAGYEGGADVLQVSINGIGYRAGNASMESVAMALEVLYGVPTGLRLDALPEVCALVTRLSGIPANYYQPIVGKGAFRYEQWGAIAAYSEAGVRPWAFPFEPELVGRKPELVIGKWSDAGAVIQKLAEYGLTATPEQVAASSPPASAPARRAIARSATRSSSPSPSITVRPRATHRHVANSLEDPRPSRSAGEFHP